MPVEGFVGQIKRLVVGEPIPSHLAHHERLSRATGLAVLSSDPLADRLDRAAAHALSALCAFAKWGTAMTGVELRRHDDVAPPFHHQRALLIKGALLFKPNLIVTSVPFHLER